MICENLQSIAGAKTFQPGADPGFSEGGGGGGGSESGVDIEGGANPSIVSLHEAEVLGGAAPQKLYMGYLILDSTKIPKMQDYSVLKLNL